MAATSRRRWERRRGPSWHPGGSSSGNDGENHRGIAEKSAYEKAGEGQLVLDLLIEAARCMSTPMEVVANGNWHCLMTVLPGSTERHLVVGCIAAITTNGMVGNGR